MEVSVQKSSSYVSPGVAAGALAATVATGGMLALAAVIEQPTVAEVVAEAIAGATPIEVIEAMIATFGAIAKEILFACVVAGQIGAGTALGAVFARRGWGLVQEIAAIALTLALVAVVLLPLLGAGVLGANGRAGAGATLASLLSVGAVFALTYAGASRALNPGGTFGAEEAASRRAFLKNATIAAGGLAVGVGGLRWIADRLAPPPVAPVLSTEVARTTAGVAAAGDPLAALWAGVPGLPTEITPNDKFYVVSKNVFRDPAIDSQTWRLQITGLVERPLTLTYDDLRGLPASNQYFTLQCISNLVGGDLIGNAEWRGVQLADLLNKAGARPEAVDLIVWAGDDYSDSIPIDKGLQPGTMLAYEMNGEVLPRSHGFPVRLLAPDIYGMKNVKWVTKIEVLEYDYKGYWQTRGWSDVATMNNTARIDVPKNASFLRPGGNYIGGIAVAGQRGIQKVEVSADGGRTWALATVKPALGPNAWVLWLYEWDMPATEPGPHKVLVRATDGTGVLQEGMVRATLPNGASGYHSIIVRYAEA